VAWALMSYLVQGAQLAVPGETLETNYVEINFYF
jgi:hypothetical protein